MNQDSKKTSVEVLDEAAETQPKNVAKRRKLLLAAAGGSVLASDWARPVVKSVILPTHAQTSVPQGGNGGGNGGENGGGNGGENGGGNGGENGGGGKECVSGTVKIEEGQIGVAPQVIDLGGYQVTITGWTEKDGEHDEGEYIGFTLDKPACFAVKSGRDTVDDCGTSWINPHSISGYAKSSNSNPGNPVKAISNITFSCPPGVY